MGLDLVEAELELPALVVELGNLSRGIGGRIEQRGEQGLGPEAAALIADGADFERLGQFGMGAARVPRGGDLDELVIVSQPSAGAPREVRLGADQPVALAAARGEAMQQGVGEEATIQNCDGAAAPRTAADVAAGSALG